MQVRSRLVELNSAQMLLNTQSISSRETYCQTCNCLAGRICISPLLDVLSGLGGKSSRVDVLAYSIISRDELKHSCKRHPRSPMHNSVGVSCR